MGILRKIKNLSFVKKAYMINRYNEYCKKNKEKQKYILFGTPVHGNIGDHAITIAEIKLLKDLDIEAFEVSSFERKYIIKYLSRTINKEDIILINGGGFMGSQWINEEEMIRDVVSNFKKNKVIIFPQSVFYSKDDYGVREFSKSQIVYSSHKDLHICVREKISYNFLIENYPNLNIILVPDIVLYLDNYNFNNTRDGVLFCLRSDVEKSLSEESSNEIIKLTKNMYSKIDYTDTVILEGIKPSKRKTFFEDKLEQFSKYELVITDRLHGMIFAALTNTPCIVLSNYNHKVKGVYEWIKDLDYICFVENINDIENIIINFKNKEFNSKYHDLNNKDKFKILKGEIKNGKY